jgi:peptide/nickel transport system substrate-binding protein
MKSELWKFLTGKTLTLFILLTFVGSIFLTACEKEVEVTVETQVEVTRLVSEKETVVETVVETVIEKETVVVEVTAPAAAGEQVYGGTLRIIAAAGPQVLSYVPLMGPSDRSFIFPGTEALVDTTDERGAFTAGVEPVLAESVDVDAENLTITFHIRKGVKFHDGSDLTAEVARWNLQQVIDAGNMPYIDYLKEMRVEDDYTLVLELNAYNNQLMPTWGWWTAQYSKEAWEAGGTTEEERIDWARSHVVGTGPFMLEEFERDVSLKWVKNPNYWREGKPYLDGIEVTIIPDPVTSRALMEAGDADVWGAPAKDALELIEMGYYKQSGWPLLPYGLWPNTGHPDSKWHDIRLREAVEYALDKEAIAQAMGQGMYVVVKALPWEGEWGYDPAAGRPYNPDKARELLEEAGAVGLKIKLLSQNDPVTQDAVTMVKGFLDAAGFDVELDLADAGRFFGTIFAPPTADEDLHWWFAGGMDTNYLQTYIRWFSTDPFTNLAFLGHTDEQAEMDKQAMAAVSLDEQAEWAGKLTKYLMDNALVIPVYGVPAYVIQQPYVHSTQYSQGFVRWQTEEVWMDEH